MNWANGLYCMYILVLRNKIVITTSESSYYNFEDTFVQCGKRDIIPLMMELPCLTSFYIQLGNRCFTFYCSKVNNSAILVDFSRRSNDLEFLFTINKLTPNFINTFGILSHHIRNLILVNGVLC